MKEFYEDAQQTVAIGIRRGWVQSPKSMPDLVKIGIARGWITPAPVKKPSTITPTWNQEAKDSTSNS